MGGREKQGKKTTRRVQADSRVRQVVRNRKKRKLSLSVKETLLGMIDVKR